MSVLEYWWVAAKIPSGIPMASATRRAAPSSRMEFGNRCIRSVVTGRL